MCVHKVITPGGIVAYCLDPMQELAQMASCWAQYPQEGRRVFNLYLIAHTSRLSDTVADWCPSARQATPPPPPIYPVTPAAGGLRGPGLEITASFYVY